RDVTSFFIADRNSETLPFFGFPGGPAELLRNGQQYGAQSRLGKIAQTEIHRIEIGRTRKLVPVGFAREGGRSGRPSPIRAAAKNQRSGLILHELMRNIVRLFNTRSARVVVVKFPRSKLSVRVEPAFDFNEPGWPEVGPSELFFASPDQFHWTACGFCQPSRFDRCVA